jgi:hypothetical protein
MAERVIQCDGTSGGTDVSSSGVAKLVDTTVEMTDFEAPLTKLEGPAANPDVHNQRA